MKTCKLSHYKAIFLFASFETRDLVHPRCHNHLLFSPFPLTMLNLVHSYDFQILVFALFKQNLLARQQPSYAKLG